MTIAVTASRGFGYEVAQAARQRGTYKVILEVTGLAADVTHDIDDPTGTFWTEALADSDYSNIAALALAKINELGNNGVSYCKWFSAELESDFVRVAGAPSGATEYQVDDIGSANKVPSIVFNAASAPTSYKIELDFVPTIETYIPAAFDAGYNS